MRMPKEKALVDVAQEFLDSLEDRFQRVYVMLVDMDRRLQKVEQAEAPRAAVPGAEDQEM